jgi:hypothetical protein
MVPTWLGPVRALITALLGPSLTGVTGFDQPWWLLADHAPGLHISELGFGAGYLAHTSASPTSASQPAPAGVPARRVPTSRIGWLHAQLRDVLDPLAATCQGQPVTRVQPIVAKV